MAIFDKINEWRVRARYMPDLPKDMFVLFVLVLTAFGAFGLGRISIDGKAGAGELRIINKMAAVGSVSPIEGTDNASLTSVADQHIAPEANSKGMYVGSRSGKTYHLPWCSGAKRIRDENKIWFQNKNEAEAKGYKPAGNCKGI